MFTPPRFVVVDDKLAHLAAIIQTFQSLGSPCIGIHYNAGNDLDSNQFRGVRGLFLDLHLLGGELGTDHRRHYAEIARILEDNIHAQGGPFILVLWTEHPRLREELIEYLDGSLADAPHARPLAILSLDKGKFINVGSGAVKDAEALRKAINDGIAANAQLAALLHWETDVLAAAGATLAALLALIPADKRTENSLPGALDLILSRLARAAVGAQNVSADPRMALNTVLAPILSDRIVNQEIPAAAADIWSRAITLYKNRENADPVDAGLINRMIHIAVPGSEKIRPTDWGAVVEYPVGQWTDTNFRRHTGVTIAQFLGGELKIEKEDRDKCIPCCVRVGAACDYAQPRMGPITYLLAVEIPENAARKKDDEGNVISLPESVWTSPVLTREGSKETYRLHVHVRFGTTVSSERSADWKVKYRLREQLLTQLISFASMYTARPGIVDFQ